jgi:hypothetical protein
MKDGEIEMIEKYFTFKYYGGIAALALLVIVAAVWLIKIWWDNKR